MSVGRDNHCRFLDLLGSPNAPGENRLKIAYYAMAHVKLSIFQLPLKFSLCNWPSGLLRLWLDPGNLVHETIEPPIAAATNNEVQSAACA